MITIVRPTIRMTTIKASIPTITATRVTVLTLLLVLTAGAPVGEKHRRKL